jgi:hypothetical protein
MFKDLFPKPIEDNDLVITKIEPYDYHNKMGNTEVRFTVHYGLLADVGLEELGILLRKAE